MSEEQPGDHSKEQPGDRSGNTWRTGNRQPTECFNHGTWCLQVRYAPYQRASSAKLRVARSTDKGYEPHTWATQAAAIAAKAHFKAWVDYGRNPLKRAAQAASAVARAAAVVSARVQPLLSTRFRGSVRLEMAKVTVTLRVGAAGAVTAALGFNINASETLLLQWRARAAQVVDRGKRRRNAAEAAAAVLCQRLYGTTFWSAAAGQLDAPRASRLAWR